MNFYDIRVPITQEFVGEYDFHNTNMIVFYEFHDQITYQGVQCDLRYTKTNKEIILKNIEADSEITAFSIGNSLLNQLAKLISIYIQRRHSETDNSLQGHVRIKWYRKDMLITLRGGESPIDSFFIKGDHVSGELFSKIDLEDMTRRLEKVVASSEASFMVTALYGSLQSLDHKAKYYHAFTIIEFIEAAFKNDVGTRIYEKKDRKGMSKLVKDYLIKNGYSSDLADKASNILSNTFATATQENRAEKLVEILNNKLGITSIKYAGGLHKIDKFFAQDLIDKRNNLFHAGGTTNIKQQMDKLILMCEKVVWYYLNN